MPLERRGRPTHPEVAARSKPACWTSQKTGRTIPSSPPRVARSPKIPRALQSAAGRDYHRPVRLTFRDRITPASPWRIYTNRIVSISRLSTGQDVRPGKCNLLYLKEERL